MSAASGLRASVVVPTHDRLAGLRDLLRCLDAQTVTADRFEVIVVDDGSSSDVREAVRPEDYGFDLRLERQSNQGAAAARQTGANHALGELLVFVDDDMQVPPEFLAAHLARHAQHDRLVVLGHVRGPDDMRELPLLERYRLGYGDRLTSDVDSGRTRLNGGHVYTGNLSLRKDLLAEVGGFDPDLLLIGDVELGIRLEKANATFALAPEAWSLHGRDGRSTDAWLARFIDDGVHWTKVGRKHPDAREANPWHFVELVNPLSRPLLALGAVAPSATGILSRGVFASARGADRLGAERVAYAAATALYGLQMFRGVGLATGGGRATVAEYREYRRAFRRTRPDERFRRLTSAIDEDYRALVATRIRHDPDLPVPRSPGAAFVTNTGFQLVVAYRVLRYLRERELLTATRVAARTIRHLYGSDIHWDAELAPGLVVVHGFGMAISRAARTGPGCILSQNVTLGDGRDSKSGAVGAPTLEADVSVGAGSTLIGPIVIGARSKVMPGCTVYESVPPNTVVESPPVTMRPRRSS